MDQRDQQILEQVVKELAKCRVCHRPISTQDIIVLDKEAKIWMIKYSCPDCHQFSWMTVDIEIQVGADRQD